jgi:hypothetical protein
MLTIGKTGSGKHIIDFLHSNGSRFTLGEEDTLWRSKGNAFIRMKGDNITANGTFKGGSADFGGGAGMPLVNASAFSTALTALSGALKAPGVSSAPLTGGALAALIDALVAAVSGACSTTMLKAL